MFVLFLFLSSILHRKSINHGCKFDRDQSKNEWKIKVCSFVLHFIFYVVDIRSEEQPIRCVHSNRLWTKSAWNESKQFKNKFNKATEWKIFQPNFAVDWDGSGLYCYIYCKIAHSLSVKKYISEFRTQVNFRSCKKKKTIINEVEVKNRKLLMKNTHERRETTFYIFTMHS